MKIIHHLSSSQSFFYAPVCRHLVIACFLFNANATTYVFAGGGYWVDPSRWSPAYPGTTIAAGDEVLINGFCNATAGITTLVNNEMLRVKNGNLLVLSTPWRSLGRDQWECIRHFDQQIRGADGDGSAL